MYKAADHTSFWFSNLLVMLFVFESGGAGVCGTADMDKLWGEVSEFARGSPAEWWATIRSVGISAVRRQYLHNDYFVGGLGLMIIGLLSRHVWKYCTLLYAFLRKSHGVFRVYVNPEDPAFTWLQEWLSEKASKDSTQLTLQARWNALPCEEDSATCHDSQLGPRPQLYYVPQLVEVQILEFQGDKVTFQLQRKAMGPSAESESGGELAALLQSASREQLVIGGPTRLILERVIQEAMDSYYSKQEGLKQTLVQRWNARESMWLQVAQRAARPIESVVLDCDVSALVADARQFLSSRSWYNDRGIPHRRGYILFGPPGCGKTSLIQALAGEFGLNVAMLGLSSREMNDDMVHSAMNSCDTRSILVLEDVDAAFTQRADGEGKANALSFSGLLNALDGISAQEGRLLLMTTNHLEKLDPALIRPGRIDFRLYLGLTSRSQIVRLFKRFHPESTEEQWEKFACSVPENAISPASIQGYLLMHRDDPQGSADHVEDLLKQHAEEEKRQRLAGGGHAIPLKSASVGV